MLRVVCCRRFVLSSSVLAAAGLGLAACALPGTVCTAVGYPSVAQIALAQPREGVDLELCDGEDCELGTVSLTGDSVDGWTADFIGGQPVVGYRLTDVAGEAVGEGSVDVDWVRVGGTEECGGPREADIELPV